MAIDLTPHQERALLVLLAAERAGEPSVPAGRVHRGTMAALVREGMTESVGAGLRARHYQLTGPGREIAEEMQWDLDRAAAST